MADWSSLPSDLVRLVADKLSAIEDLAALTWVCRSFNSTTPKEHWRRHSAPRRSPWLLLCSQDGDGENLPSTERGLLNMYKDAKKFSMDLPELQGRRCWGSRYGWIVTLGLDLQLHLFNPLTRRRILLPQPAYDEEEFDDEAEKVNWIRSYYIDRAILIKRPPSSFSSCQYDDFLVVLTGFLNQLRVIRPSSWENAKLSMLPKYVGSSPHRLYDFACRNGQIYMLAILGSLYICRNFDGPGDPVAEQITRPDKVYFTGEEDKLYLVESRGDLLMVSRFRAYDEGESLGETYHFDAYKFDDKGKKWIKLDDLGGRTIFVGDCQTIALEALEAVSCRRNCIYFCDDDYEVFNDKDKGGRDMGIFDLKEKTIERFYNGADSLSAYSAPKWFIPALI